MRSHTHDIHKARTVAASSSYSITSAANLAPVTTAEFVVDAFDLGGVQ
jgi:hypothetical protein